MWSPCHTTALVTLSGISASVTQHPCHDPFYSQVSDHRNLVSVSQGQQNRKTWVLKPGTVLHAEGAQPTD